MKIFSYSVLCFTLSGVFLTPLSAQANCNDIRERLADQYVYIHPCTEGQPIRAFKQGNYGFLNADGEEITEFIYDKAKDFEQGFASVSIGDKWGAIDTQGKLTVPFLYDYGFVFSEGLALVYKGGQTEIIDGKGKSVLPSINNIVSNFKNGLAIIDYSEDTDIIKADGSIVIKNTDKKPSALTDYLYTIPTDKKFGSVNIIDLNGNIYFTDVFTTPVQAYDFDGISIKPSDDPDSIFVLTDMIYGAKTFKLMDSQGNLLADNLVTSEDPVRIINGFIVVDTGTHLQAIDTKGNIRLSGNFDTIYPFINNDIAVVLKENKYYYYKLASEPSQSKHNSLNSRVSQKNQVQGYSSDNIGQLAIDEGFDTADYFYDELAFVTQDQFSGFINLNGNRVISTPYSNATSFINNTSIFKTSNDKFGVMDNKGRTIIAPSYDEIIRSKYSPLFIVKYRKNEDGTPYYGVFDINGNLMLAPKYTSIKMYQNFALVNEYSSYDSQLIKLTSLMPSKYLVSTINSFVDGYAIVEFRDNKEDNYKFGIINDLGEIVSLDNAYDVHNLSKGLFVVDLQQGTKVLVNEKGQRIPTAQYDSFSDFKYGLSMVSKNGLYGLINNKGHEVVPPIYNKIRHISKDIILVEKEGLKGLINSSGVELLPVRYLQLQPLGNGLFSVNKGKGIIDKNGHDVVFPRYRNIKRFDNGYFNTQIYTDSGLKHGLLNPKAETVFEPLYNQIHPLIDDRYLVDSDDYVGIVDSQGQYVFPLEYKAIEPIYCYDELENSLIAVSKGNRLWALATLEGEVLTSEKYEEVKNTSANLILIKQNGKWGLLSYDNKVILKPTYKEVGIFSKGLLAVKKHDKYGYIDTKGNMVIDFKFDKVHSFNDQNQAYVEIDNKAYKIDKFGNIIKETTIIRSARAESKYNKQ